MQAKQLRVLSAGVELAVYRFGNPQGIPLLLVHGYPDNHYAWLGLIEQLADGCHGIGLYRANFIRCLFKPRKRSTSVPVQLLVPSRDRFVNPQLFDDLAHWAPNLQRRELDGGHWQLLAEPTQLAEFVRSFVRQQEALRQPPCEDAA